MDGVQKKIIPNTPQLQFFYKFLILSTIANFFSFPLEPLNPVSKIQKTITEFLG